MPVIWIDQLYQSALAGTVEPTLSLRFSDLMALTAERAGYGFRASQNAGLSAKEETEIGLYVDEGYRDFLLSYEWSFAKPVATSVLWSTTTATTTMTVAGEGNRTITASADTFFPTMVGHTIVSTNGSYTIESYTSATIVTVTSDASADTGLAFQITATGNYRLPDDFGGLIGDVYFQANEGRWIPLSETGTAELLELLQVSTAAGRPTVCATESNTIGVGVGQRFDLLVWRVPDTDYTVRYQYQVLPDKLSLDNYPYGGSRHAETIKYACFAARERSKEQTVDGPAERNYKRLLSLSIRADQRGNRAGSLGILANAQPSRRGSRYFPQARTVTVGGVNFP